MTFCSMSRHIRGSVFRRLGPEDRHQSGRNAPDIGYQGFQAFRYHDPHEFAEDVDDEHLIGHEAL